MKERESTSEVSEVTSWIHAWVRSHVFHLSMAFSASPPGAEPLTMRQSHVLRLLTPPRSHGGLSTLLSEQLPTQGTSVHRERADMLVEAPANGGARSNANMAHGDPGACSERKHLQLFARPLGELLEL